MLIKSVVVGPLQVNCFVVADEKSKKALVIDPGDEPDRIMDMIKENGLKIEYIICTHGHFDHVGAVSDLKKETGAKVLIHKDELEIYDAAKDMAAFWGYDLDPLPDPDVLANDGDVIRAGDLEFDVFHSPGHSPGGICLYGHETAITGDTLFAGSIGRTDFHGGDINKLKESFKRLMSLPEDTRVLCGHGAETTIGREKRENMFSEEFLS
ncbi:MAG: MBL fold metallo-hydrolase [Nitrospirae bacterium]|nr:MBL fold metallo-hydrolase [Nitrospirota bacterium]MCL5978437.1 MBL fold metallo-hydrolase [Nitrospirota bacterium]